MSGPFKMKGSPMKRNFGIGASPAKHTEEEAGHPHKNPHHSDQKVRKNILTGRTTVKTKSPGGNIKTKEVYDKSGTLIKEKKKYSRKFRKMRKQQKEGVSVWEGDKPVYPEGHKKYKGE